MGKVIAIVALLAFVILAIVVQTTTPMQVGPLGIITVFGLIYLSVLGPLTFIIYGIHLLISALRKRLDSKASAFTVKHAYYYASVLALAPVILIAMQSVGRSGLYDVTLIVIFEIIACIYITKRHK